MTPRADPEQVCRMSDNHPVEQPIKVAMTLEQCWHRVPGGTAVAGIGMARAVDALADTEVIGVAARHASSPPAAWTPPVEVRQLPLPRLALYESWHRLRRPRVERATGPIDLIHATTFAIPPRTAPLIVTIHDLAFLNDPAHFTKRGVAFFMKGLELSIREADMITCPSRATADDCIRNGFSSQQVRVVPMGVEARVATDEEVIAAKDRYGLRRPYVLWLGTVEPRKNLKRLIESFMSLGHNDLDLVLVGPQGWNEDIDALIGAAGRSRIKSLGFVPHSDLAPLYGGAEVFCFPSLFEGFGLPVLEAMIQGTPVVTSRGTSTEEIAGDAAILVDPHDSGAISEALEKVLGDETLKSRMNEKGTARAASYTWQRTAEGLRECYSELLA